MGHNFHRFGRARFEKSQPVGVRLEKGGFDKSWIEVPEKNGRAKKDRNGSGIETKLVTLDIERAHRSDRL